MSKDFSTMTYKNYNELIHSNEYGKNYVYLKAHYQSGDVCIYNSDWKISADEKTIDGTGILYDHNRSIKKEGPISTQIDDIVLFETNRKLNYKERIIAGRTLLIGLDVALGVVCIIDPKICFGSCPTFYIDETKDVYFSDAEGFSSAILPRKEYLDIDALSHTVKGGTEFDITMKNEALETHCINHVDLYAVPKLPNFNIFQSPKNKFFNCSQMIPILNASYNNECITEKLESIDYDEVFVESDSLNMKSKDQIYINFNCDESKTDLGFVLSFRQSLMTTYILYNGMSYMGHMFSDFFAKSEVEGNLENDIMKHLGGVDVYQWDEISQSWLHQGSFNETGPIAFNKQIIPFKRASKNIEVKLKLEFNKGLWKFDYAGLAVLEDSIQPYKISPHNVTVKSQNDNEALELLNNEGHLISMPGSNYKLSYNIPNEHENYEVFIASKGYYLEWMRKSWLDDVDIPNVLMMKYRPKKFLKDHALDYKKYESISEELFWGSRIDSDQFSYYE